MTTRRVRGASLGLVIILINILLVAALVMATSNRTVSDLFNPDDAAPTSVGPEPDAVQDTASRTGSPTLAPLPSPDVSRQTASEPDLSERFTEGEDLTVVVLGDQTGTDPADWVRAWAELLATERTVEYLTPTVSDPTQFGEPTLLGNGESSVSIFNASLVGGTPDYAAERLGAYLPQGTDLVLLNFGRSNTDEDLEEGLDELWDALEDSTGAEVYAVVQPPRQDGAEQLTDLTREWAQDADASVIDVAEVFEDEELTALTVSTRDPLSVNLAGAARWAEIVQHETFGVELAAVDPTTPPEILPPTLPTATQPIEPPVEEPPVEEPSDTPPPADPPPYTPPPYTPPPYTPPPTSDPEPTTAPDPTSDPEPTTTPPPSLTSPPTVEPPPTSTTSEPEPTEPTVTFDPDDPPGGLPHVVLELLRRL
ncbi:SGNH/GDSL hydrolase family protein [Ornithinimicrobium murale]|uniref:SGNH/GDSL hydrolase family protein n=1 Tax=Ornithinimicrobium murale TaxID=1050153 RepID=UPI000E0D7307|nr:SGNH/GDSL hydrolase family protein [Ornithinimicrobium murale]